MIFIRRILSLALLCFYLAPGTGFAATVQEAIEKAQQDIKQANQRRMELQRTIQAERLELAESLTGLELERAELQRTVNDLLSTKNRMAAHREAVLMESRRNAEERATIHHILTEYRRSAASRMPAADAAYYRTAFKNLDEILAQTSHVENIPVTMQRVLDLALTISTNKLNGWQYDGECVDEEGLVQTGRIFVLGPYAVFMNENKTGLCINRSGVLLPGLFTDLSAQDHAAIRDLFQGKEASVPMDFTGGKAIQWMEQKKSITEQLRAGGVVMIPLILVGLAALLISVFKGIQLMNLSRQYHRVDVQAAMNLLKKQDETSWQTFLREQDKSIRLMMETVSEYKKEPRETIEEIMHERLLSCLPRMEKYLGTLAVLGAVAPLLGLLGTVTGIIHVFRMVTLFGSNDASILSGGISEALVTTEFGLVIAIPVLLVHAWLNRRVRTLAGQLEDMAVLSVQELHES